MYYIDAHEIQKGLQVKEKPVFHPVEITTFISLCDIFLYKYKYKCKIYVTNRITALHSKYKNKSLVNFYQTMIITDFCELLLCSIWLTQSKCTIPI